MRFNNLLSMFLNQSRHSHRRNYSDYAKSDKHLCQGEANFPLPSPLTCASLHFSVRVMCLRHAIAGQACNDVASLVG